jgi:hypothetical protein
MWRFLRLEEQLALGFAEYFRASRPLSQIVI